MKTIDVEKLINKKDGKMLHYSDENSLVLWYLPWKFEYIVHKVCLSSGDTLCLEHGNYFDDPDEAMLYFLKRKGKIKENRETIWKVSQLSIHGEHLCDFGFFESEELAIKSFMEGFEKIYKGFIKDVYSYGRNQWGSDKYDFLIDLKEIDLNRFEEL